MEIMNFSNTTIFYIGVFAVFTAIMAVPAVVVCTLNWIEGWEFSYYMCQVDIFTRFIELTSVKLRDEDVIHAVRDEDIVSVDDIPSPYAAIAESSRRCGVTPIPVSMAA